MNVYRVFVGMPERRYPLGKPELRLDNSITKDVRRTRWGGIDWIHMAQDRHQKRALVNIVMNLLVP
jgi:hypothetical protein